MRPTSRTGISGSETRMLKDALRGPENRDEKTKPRPLKDNLRGERRRRVCGCTDDNCQQCIDAQGYPCRWIEPDLCSRCAPIGKRRRYSECCRAGSYKHQVPMPIGGRRQDIDYCIADIVAALNAANIITSASCCGHGADGIISLEDGRELIVKWRK